MKAHTATGRDGVLRSILLQQENEDERLLLEAIASVMADGGEIRALADNKFIHDMEMRFGVPSNDRT